MRNIRRCTHTHATSPMRCHGSIFFLFSFRLVATHSTWVFTWEKLGRWSSPPTKTSIKLVTPTSQLPVLAYIAQIPLWYSWFLSIRGMKGGGGGLFCSAMHIGAWVPRPQVIRHQIMSSLKKKSWFAPAEDWFFSYFFPPSLSGWRIWWHFPNPINRLAFWVSQRDSIQRTHEAAWDAGVKGHGSARKTPVGGAQESSPARLPRSLVDALCRRSDTESVPIVQKYIYKNE